MSRGREVEYSEYVAARLSWLRRLAMVVCGDWQRGDDLVQATLVTLYVRWGGVRAAADPAADRARSSRLRGLFPDPLEVLGVAVDDG